MYYTFLQKNNRYAHQFFPNSFLLHPPTSGITLKANDKRRSCFAGSDRWKRRFRRLFLVFPFLILWASGLMVLRLVRPRPGISALFRQPGWWACFGSLLGVVLAIAAEGVIEFPAPSGIVPLTVLVAWVVLAVTRKWQSEASWIDRAGRLLGILWLATIPIYLIGFVWSWLK